MRRSEEVVRTLRDEIAGGLATNVVDVEHYEAASTPPKGRRERRRWWSRTHYPG